MSATLNSEQRDAVLKNDSSLLIVAGAGTGKTRVLVEKIVHLLESGTPGDRILALTFTNKASDEMRERVASQYLQGRSPFIGTFHSFCVSLLREFASELGIVPHFAIFDRDTCRRILKRCMKDAAITDITPRVMQHVVGRLKTGLAAEDDTSLVEQAERVLPLYALAMEQEQALDFDDLLLRTSELLQRTISVRDLVQERYSYILVDEFQDTDGIQNQLINLLKGPKTHIVAVGDTDQTIYSWRGATVHNMLSFTETYDPASVVFLTKNYRSSATILAAANAVIAKNIYRQEKTLEPTRDSGDFITLFGADDPEDEGGRIAGRIRSLQTAGVPYRDMAILFRANFQARALEMALLEHQLPYSVLGVRFFDRAEVKDLLAYLVLAQNPSSREAFSRAATVPRRGIGARTLDRIFSGDETLLSPAMAKKVALLRSDIARAAAVSEHGSAVDVLRELLKLLDYRAHLVKTYDNPDERLHEVNELLVFADRFFASSRVGRYCPASC